jgi:hypothetical protein
MSVIFLLLFLFSEPLRVAVTVRDDFRGDTVVVHPTARPIENHRALQKGVARLVIHAFKFQECPVRHYCDIAIPRYPFTTNRTFCVTVSIC